MLYQNTDIMTLKEKVIELGFSKRLPLNIRVYNLIRILYEEKHDVFLSWEKIDDLDIDEIKALDSSLCRNYNNIGEKSIKIFFEIIK